MNSEELREMLIDLNRAKDLERSHRAVSDGVLEGLSIISRSTNTHEAFNQLLKVLKKLIGFDCAFVLREESDGLFKCAASTDSLLENTVWPSEKLFKRVLAGQPVVLFDIEHSSEWQTQSEEIRTLAVSALHAPLNTPTSKAIFICISTQKAFFHKYHQKLLVKFMPLTSQALYNLESSQKIREEADKLKKAQQALKQLDQLKSEFISTAAHELRTPIASIMGYTELLSDNVMSQSITEEQKADFHQEILDNSERLSKIIDDVLDVSRIEAGRSIPLSKEQTSIHGLLNKAVNRFRLTAKQNIHLELSHNLPDIIEIDAHRISQVVDNLLSNAIKYSPAESNILITAKQDKYYCLVSVIDEGKGMNEEQIGRVFDKFYRADATDTAVRGLGLGMSIVKQIIEDHRGEILVKSKVGEGTKVHFKLPLSS